MSGNDQPENTEMKNIDELPEEVLLELFSYLLLPDRKHVRLVNKHWYELCNSARLTKYETFQFCKNDDLDNANIIRTSINVKLNKMKISKATLELPFWREHGCRVKSLIMRNAYFTDPVLYDIINYCPNVEHLSFANIYFEQKSSIYAKISCNKLENLTELEFFGYLSRYSNLRTLTRNNPKLKYLSVGITANNEGVHYDNILMDAMSLVKTQSQTLEALCFTTGCNLVNDSLFKSRIEEIGVQLTCLLIPHCKNVTDNLLFAYAKKFVNLERLDLSDNCQLGRNMDPTLFSNLKKLKLVSLRSTSITDQVLSAVAALDEIQGIDMSFCRSLTAGGLSRAFGTKLHEKILHIKLDTVLVVTDQVLTQILPQLPNLISMDLSSCKEVTAVGVSAITKNCQLLRLLSLSHCPEINDLSEMNNLKGLLFLHLSCCSQVVDAVAKMEYLELQLINLYGVPVTRADLKSLLVNCPSLQRVVLNKYIVKHKDLDGILETVTRETGRKRPSFEATSHYYLHHKTIFGLSQRYFNGFPCNSF